MKRFLAICLVAMIGAMFSGCPSDGKTCGAGTVAEGGSCVPQCANSEYFDGTACQTIPACAAGTTFNAATGDCEADLTGCAAGTEEVNGQCVPVCANDEYWDGAECQAIPACANGTTFNAATGECEADLTGCAPGTSEVNGECVPDVVCGGDTHPENGECVPNVLPDPDVPEAALGATFTLAAEGETVSLGGTIDLPVDEDGDGFVDGNWDQFQFQGSAGDYLNIFATSEGATLPSFALMGFDAAGEEVLYQRIGLNPNGLDVEREVYLPLDATYVLLVTDYNHMVNALFQQSGLPVGGPDFTYYVEVETLPAPTATAVDGADLVNAPFVDSGDLSDNGLRFFSVTNTPPGELIALGSYGVMADGMTPSDLAAQALIFAPDGSLMADANESYFVAEDGEYLVVQDFMFAMGPNREYTLALMVQPTPDCDVDDCTAGAADAGEAAVYLFDVLANSVWAYAAVHDNSDIEVRIFDSMGQLLYFGESYYDFWSGSDLVAANLAYAYEDMQLIVSITGYNGGTAVFTQEFVEQPEVLITEGVNAALTPAIWPAAAYWPAGVGQFDGTAGQLAVFTDFDMTNWGDLATLILNTDMMNIAAVDNNTGDLVEPAMTMIPADDRFMHYPMDVSGSEPGEYAITMGFITPAASLGTPTDGAPITVSSPALDAITMTGAIFFTGVMDEGYKIEVSDPNTTLTPQVHVMAFASDEFWDPMGMFTFQVAFATGEPADTGWFVSPYDGDMLIVVRDSAGVAVGGEVLDVTVTKALCTPDSLRCDNDGTDDTIEICDGDAWTVLSTCETGVACIDLPEAHCYVAGDTCADAIEVDISSGGATVNGMAATNAEGAPGCTGWSANGLDSFYWVTLAEGDSINIVESSAFDNSLYLFTDCADVAGTCVAGADDTLTGEDEVIDYTVPAGAGGVYYIGADTYSGGGDHTVVITVN